MSKPNDLFSFEVAVSSELGVDRKNKMILGCKIMQLGELNDDRPMFADMETLENLVDFMQQPKKGIKARFTHSAAMGGDGLNTHLGRWVNARIDGDSVRADLQLADAAEISPIGNLSEFVLTLAEEDSESFGVSVAGVLNPAMFEDDEKTIYPIRFERIWSADFVGDPAATRGGLFSNAKPGGNPVTAEFNKPNDELADAELSQEVAADEQNSEAPAEVVETQPEPVEENAEALAVENLRSDAKPYVAAFGNQGAAWFLEGKSLQDCYQIENERLKAHNKELFEQVDELILALNCSENSGGESEPLSVAPEQTSETEADAAKREKVEKLKHRGASKPVIGWAAQYTN